MIKGKAFFLLFFVIILAIQYALSMFFLQLYPSRLIFLNFGVTLSLAFLGNTLLQIAVKKDGETEFAGAFMTFTTIQMLISLGYCAILKYSDLAATNYHILHFVVLFFLGLIVQTFYFVQLSKTDNQQKKF